MLWLGIDVGGTFTDLVLYDDESGRLALAKTPSTPQDHSEGMLAGIIRLGIPLEAVARLAHGTTIATNTVLERTGAPTAMITTRGFRDVLEVGRGNRERIGLYDIKATRPPALVPRSLRLEVDERTLYDGTVFRAVDPEAVAALAATLQARGIQAVAICFLHAYANDRNETRAKAAVRQAAPELFVSTSAEVLPEYREYERFATTVLNVYVAPRMGRYLGSLRARLADRGFRQDVAIMTSNGGTMSARRMADSPVHSMLSGPAAGVIGATFVARQIGQRDLITYDMGGTSTDVCLVKDLEFAMSTEGRIGPLPNRVWQIEINSIGAGGGSIAWLGAGKFVSVGPQSAGAVPGPACYGRGGTAPTVTDANLRLGRLHAGEPLGGEIHLRPALAREAIERLAAAVGIEPLRMADGIVKIAVAKMTGAIKEISVMRGHDPRGFTLFAYGGAGPLHAALIAAELGMPRVVIPPLPGNFSAFGLLAADVRHEYVRTRLVPTRDLGAAELGTVFAELRDEGRRRLGAEGFPPEAMRFEARLDMRYVGQAFELSVPVHDGWTSMADVDAAFYAAHEQRYAHAVEDPVEIVSFRLSAYGLTTKPALPAQPGGTASLEAARLGVRPVFFDDAFADTPVFARERLPAAARLRGPALVDEPGTTTLVPPGFRAAVGQLGVLVLERE
jgi:N-methylhydantoinase A